MLTREYLDKKMMSTHMDALTSAFTAKELKGFAEPILESDSVISKNESKRIGYISRHLLTGDLTHTLRLEGEFYERV